MYNDNLNLCDEILNEMVKLQFNTSSIEYIRNNSRVIECNNGNAAFQRTVLITVFYNIFMEGKETVPSQIRISLNISNNPEGWLDDMKLVILPFLKINEDKFF
jgi:hypothetical protein